MHLGGQVASNKVKVDDERHENKKYGAMGSLPEVYDVNKVAYVIRVLDSVLQVDAAQWNQLLSEQDHASPFMRHEYLAALQRSGSATETTGWRPRFVTLWQASSPDTPVALQTLVAACPLYIKHHSYGEYVFDWAWANAYAQNGLDYYPKAVVSVPFTPVPGSRLLARDAHARQALVQALVTWCRDEGLSSLHLLFASEADLTACKSSGLMLRHTVQFHWENKSPALGYRDFDDFLATLRQDKRKKIRQERRRVSEAGVTFRNVRGRNISAQDWDFFYRCYERTYLEHGNAPYLNRDFFTHMAQAMPDNWVLFVAERDTDGERLPIAASLIAIDEDPQKSEGPLGLEIAGGSVKRVAYGRYWGALERVDCLHFEACYYQPLQWCIEHGYQRFEGGAQGEHKMARALLPVKTHSAHWLAHPAFAEAVERFLQREDQGVDSYLSDLTSRSPFRQTPEP